MAGVALVTVGVFLARPVVAHAAGIGDEETQFVFNTFAFLIWGALVMWMCAGFTMLESGSVRTKNASMICLKNIGLYSIAGLAYFFIGYNLMYGDFGRDWSILGVEIGSLVGSFKFLYGPTADEVALVGGEAGKAAAVVDAAVANETVHSTMSDWFFQMVFVATAASIVSGAMAERVKMWSFFLFVLVLTADTLPAGRRVDLGRRVAERAGVQGLRRLDDRARRRRLGRARGHHGRRAQAGQVQA